jgi:hypothetical protein
MKLTSKYLIRVRRCQLSHLALFCCRNRVHGTADCQRTRWRIRLGQTLGTGANSVQLRVEMSKAHKSERRPLARQVDGICPVTRKCVVLRTGCVSVVIRRLVHHSWYGPAREGPSWAGTNWKGSAGQGSAMSHETGTRPKGFSYVYKYQLATQVEDIDNKQCFHDHFMYTCLLRAACSSFYLPGRRQWDLPGTAVSKSELTMMLRDRKSRANRFLQLQSCLGPRTSRLFHPGMSMLWQPEGSLIVMTRALILVFPLELASRPGAGRGYSLADLQCGHRCRVVLEDSALH